jgi:hypothetical protein
MLAVLAMAVLTLPAEAKDLTATQALDAAVDILLGDPYGATVDEVKSNIKRQERVGTDDPECAQPAWKFTVAVPPSEQHENGIKGFLCLSVESGEILKAGLPFLD